MFLTSGSEGILAGSKDGASLPASFLSCLTQLDHSARSGAPRFLFSGLDLFAGETIRFSDFNYVYIDL